MTLSIGVAERVDEESIDAWLRRADLAMYEAKRQGRDRLAVSEPPSAERERSR